MIQTETFEKNGRTLVRTRSDAGYRIRQDSTGAIYDEAVDPIESGRTYAETGEPVQGTALTAEEALNIITGVAQ